MISVFLGIVLGVLLSALAILLGVSFGFWLGDMICRSRLWREILSRVSRSPFGGVTSTEIFSS